MFAKCQKGVWHKLSNKMREREGERERQRSKRKLSTCVHYDQLSCKSRKGLNHREIGEGRRNKKEESTGKQCKECVKIGISFSAYGICINFHLGANERQTSQVKTGKLQNNEQGEQGEQGEGKQSALQAYHNNGE